MKTNSSAKVPMALIQANEASSKPIATTISQIGRKIPRSFARRGGKPKSIKDWRDPAPSLNLETPATRKTAQSRARPVNTRTDIPSS
jgi:hypothetical protein